MTADRREAGSDLVWRRGPASPIRSITGATAAAWAALGRPRAGAGANAFVVGVHAAPFDLWPDLVETGVVLRVSNAGQPSGDACEDAFHLLAKEADDQERANGNEGNDDDVFGEVLSAFAGQIPLPGCRADIIGSRRRALPCRPHIIMIPIREGRVHRNRLVFNNMYSRISGQRAYAPRIASSNSHYGLCRLKAGLQTG